MILQRRAGVPEIILEVLARSGKKGATQLTLFEACLLDKHHVLRRVGMKGLKRLLKNMISQMISRGVVVELESSSSGGMVVALPCYRHSLEKARGLAWDAMKGASARWRLFKVTSTGGRI